MKLFLSVAGMKEEFLDVDGVELKLTGSTAECTITTDHGVTHISILGEDSVEVRETILQMK